MIVGCFESAWREQRRREIRCRFILQSGAEDAIREMSLSQANHYGKSNTSRHCSGPARHAGVNENAWQ